MPTINETWSGTRQFNVPGRMFRLLSTANPVDVKLYSRGQRIHDADANAVEGGYWYLCAPGAEFDRVEITTGASEAVKFFYTQGGGGYDRSAGSVSVSGTATTKDADAVSGAAALATIGTSNVAVGTASAGRRSITFRSPSYNTGLIAVGPYAQGTTLENNAVVLAPGQSRAFKSDEGAALQFYAIASAAGQSLVFMGVS